MRTSKTIALPLMLVALTWVDVAGAICNMGTTFTPNSKSDAPDEDIADGYCRTADGKCTLRAAIMQGNAIPLCPVSVQLTPGQTYFLSIPGSPEDKSATGDLDVQRPMRIGVPKSATNKARINGSGIDRIFQFSPTSGYSELYGVEIVGGAASMDNNGWKGAAIYSEADDLAIGFSTIHDNGVTESDFASLTIVHAGAGAIHINDSKVYDNGSSSAATGLMADCAGCELVVQRSTVSGNNFGILLDYGSWLALTASMIVHNSDNIWTQRGSDAFITGSTIGSLDMAGKSGNTADIGVVNSVIGGTGNGEACGQLGDGAAHVNFVTSYNIYSDMSCFSDTFIDHSLHNTSPQLVQTYDEDGLIIYSPSPSSPAIDRAPASLCEDDQGDHAGRPRPVSYLEGGEARCDTGAVELPTSMESEDPPPEPAQPAIFSDDFE